MERPSIYMDSFVLAIRSTGIPLGDYGLSESMAARNLSACDVNVLGLNSALGLGGSSGLSAAALGAGSIADASISEVGAHQAAATPAGTELAACTDQAPPSSNRGVLRAAGLVSRPTHRTFTNMGPTSGRMLSNQPSTPATLPGLWIVRSAIWSLYAALHLGGWVLEPIYVPSPSSINIYKAYPSGSPAYA